MKRFSAPPSVYADPTRPPDDDDSDASSLSDGSKKVKTAQSFESLFNSESLSDIVLDINRGEFVFHAHKMIVGLKSERLAALITNVISMPPDNSGGKPVLYLQEPRECSAVFSRFLYFIYSGAVWLHRDYVVPLFQLSVKYGVVALAAHCENYIVQILNKMLNIDPSLPLTQSLQISSVCDLFEDPGYRDETKKAAFQVLCKRFGDFVRTERWITASWTTVRDLLHSDECISEENLILVSATDWMKRNKLQDKARIQEILSSIRYPRLPRRVLYHLHATSSFKKFPPVQDLIEAAIRFHCFKDVPEAQNEFSGLQYRGRGFCSHNNNNNNNNNNNDTNSINNNNNNSIRNSRHTSMCGVENDNHNLPSEDIEDNNNTLQAVASPEENQISFPGEFNNTTTLASSSSLSLSPSSHTQTLRNGDRGGENMCRLRPLQRENPCTPMLNDTTISQNIHPSSIHSINSTTTAAPTLPVRQHRSRSEDRHGSPLREHRISSTGSRNHHHNHHTSLSTTSSSPTTAATSTGTATRRHGSVFDPPVANAISSFHSPCSPVATIQPLVVHGQSRHSNFLEEDGSLINRDQGSGGSGSNSTSNNIPPVTLANISNSNYDNNDSDNNNLLCHSLIRKL